MECDVIFPVFKIFLDSFKMNKQMSAKIVNLFKDFHPKVLEELATLRTIKQVFIKVITQSHGCTIKPWLIVETKCVWVRKIDLSSIILDSR